MMTVVTVMTDAIAMTCHGDVSCHGDDRCHGDDSGHGDDKLCLSKKLSAAFWGLKWFQGPVNQSMQILLFLSIQFTFVLMHALFVYSAVK